MFGGPVAVDGPLVAPGRRGLLNAAVMVTDEGDFTIDPSDDDVGPTTGQRQPHWAGGFQFSPDACGAIDPTVIECLPVTDKTKLVNPGVVDYTPFLTYGFDECTTMDQHRDREGRARRNLLATESWQLERELFDGIASKSSTPDTDNPFLTDGDAVDVTGGGALSSIPALARVERDLLRRLHGQRGMIHATPDLVTFWQNGGALHLEGNTILTVLDTIIVAGSGYSGNAPDGTAAPAGTTWAYGTGMVYLRQGFIFDPGVENPESRVNRDLNSITWRLERPNAVYYSPCCVNAVHAALT